MTQTSTPDAGKLLRRELDHIQAILGRYDTFFFLMKQLCATAVFVSIAEFLKHSEYFASTQNQSKPPVWTVMLIPLFFLGAEYFFRFFHWSGYVARLDTLRKSLNNRQTPQCTYVIKEGINFPERRWLNRLLKHICTSFKPFDWLVFYPTLSMAVLLIQGGSAFRTGMYWWVGAIVVVLLVAVIVRLVAHCLRRPNVAVTP